MKSIQLLLFLSTALVTALLALVLALKVGLGGVVHYEEEFFCGTVNDDFGYVANISENRILLDKHSYGQALFQSNCVVCHSYSSVIVGPALKGVEQRRSKEWLVQFIKSPMAMVEAGDSAAVAVYNEFNKMIMPSFENLSHAEIDSILTYISAHEKVVSL